VKVASQLDRRLERERAERLPLKVVAECTDICYFGDSPEAYAHKLDVLKQHCEHVGRRFYEI
jgi:hypothetical protein